MSCSIEPLTQHGGSVAMTTSASVSRLGPLEIRARQSLGSSDATIYRMVARALKQCRIDGGLLVDVGCGVGNLYQFVCMSFARYVGVDAVEYEGFPADCEFHRADLDNCKVPLPDGCADAVAAVETIEHLENPRAFMRELVRLTKPGGWVIVTTPNQLSLLSLLTIAIKGRFSAFQDPDYPAHRTALLEVDLRRIASECGLTDMLVAYNERGRIVLTPWHYPNALSRMFPRACSDNLLIAARKPVTTAKVVV